MPTIKGLERKIEEFEEGTKEILKDINEKHGKIEPKWKKDNEEDL